MSGAEASGYLRPEAEVLHQSAGPDAPRGYRLGSMP